MADAMGTPRARSATKLLRPPGFLVFGIFLLLVALVWWLFADKAVQWSVEGTGESLVGAKVELTSADIRAGEGSVRLTGLQVANPSAPMSNLMEAGEITVDLMVEPLLEKKVVVQNLVVTGVRFNTPRETSGALDNPDPEAGRLWQEVNQWADLVDVPSFSLEGLGGVIRTDAVDPDSLQTVQYARSVLGRVDSLRGNWESRLTALDPRPRIDSMRTVAERLESFRLTPLNALQVPDLIRDGRAAIENVTSLQEEITSLDDTVRAGLATIEIGPETVSRLREQDLAYARGLLDIPSLDAPTISPALFSGTALAWMKPILYWVRTAERFLPPGLDPRNRPGPTRVRADGTTVAFPGRAEWPGFLVQEGELGMEIGGSGAAAGRYSALLTDLTTAPSLLGRPMELTLAREEAATGPRGLSLTAVLDHTTELIRDSVAVALSGVRLPEVPIEAFGARLDLGEGDTDFSVLRSGDQIAASMRWVSSNLSWTRGGEAGDPSATGGAATDQADTAADAAAAADQPAPPAATPQIGTAEWARDLVWRTLNGVQEVVLEIGIEGDLTSPSLSVSSNLGQAVANSLQAELGAEIEAAEARIRAELDRQIQPLVQDARGRVGAVQSGVAEQVAGQRAEVDDLRARLEARVEELVGRVGRI